MTKQEIIDILIKEAFVNSGFANGSYNSKKVEVQGFKTKISYRRNSGVSRYSFHIYKKGKTIASKNDIFAPEFTIFNMVAEKLIEAINLEVEALLLLDNGISQSSSFSEPNDNT